MGQGIRVFGDDFNNIGKAGTYTASSNTTYAQYAFDNKLWSNYVSSGEDNDAIQVYLERDYGIEVPISAFYAYGTNLPGLVFQYWSGSAWINITTSNATIYSKEDISYGFLKTSTGAYYRTSTGALYRLATGGTYHHAAITNGSLFTSKVRAIGSVTNPSNAEKVIIEFYAFENIGQFEFRPILTPTFTSKDNIQELDNGKSFVYKQGGSFRFNLSLVHHFNQNDLDLLQTMLDKNSPMFIWKSGGDVNQFKYTEEGHRFEDIFKISVIGNRTRILKDNRYNLSGNVTISLIEVE